MTVQVVPHHVLMISNKAGNVISLHHIQQYFDAIRTAVDHVPKDVQVIIVSELHGFQHPEVKVVHTMNIAADI